MTVSSEVSVAGPFYGNGSTRTFPYAFKILDARHIRAVLISASGDVSDLSLDNGDYSVTGIGSETGGDVIKATPLLAGQTLTLVRRLPLTQETSLENQGAYYPEVVERRLDQMVMQIQSVKEATERSLTVEPGQEKPSMTQIAAAEGYAQGAKQSRDEASQFSRDAAGRVEEATRAASLSERWASAPENEEVVPGSGQYSARHQAKKAEAAKDSVIAGWSAAVRNAPLKATPSMADEFGFADSGDSWTIKKQTFAKLQEVFGLPIGGVMMMPGNGNNPPAGFLLMNGAPCTPAYPQLRAWLLANGASTNGEGDPIIEDMGGYFPRGWRAGQLVDSGRVFGAVQQDAFQAHRHQRNLNNRLEGVIEYTGAGSGGFYSGWNKAAAEYQTTGDVADGRIAMETRPVNKTFSYWIKAYAADQTPGSADFTSLANKVQSVLTRLSALEADTPFTSTPQTVVGSGIVVVEHSLGKLPSWITLDFVNTQTEGGYSPGDVVNVAPSLPDNYGGHGITVSKTRINIMIIFSSGGVYFNQKIGGAPYLINPAKWQMIVRANG
ncbi:hypothetical protein [uncultured Agrobacterium sp.]|uniref:hypothetical protein n=1 Tax=uncultured Agrobacterium sp. TaxID=157277 RepID=UPI002587F78D|nr:hypothetical protein [uncultured Agrobacterium sp.]